MNFNQRWNFWKTIGMLLTMAAALVLVNGFGNLFWGNPGEPAIGDPIDHTIMMDVLVENEHGQLETVQVPKFGDAGSTATQSDKDSSKGWVITILLIFIFVGFSSSKI